MSQKAVCASTKRPIGTINRTLKAYYKEGRIADTPRHRLERCTSAEEDMLVVTAAADDPFLSARKIMDELGLIHLRRDHTALTARSRN